ncbi:MAG: rod shape-determining protein [Candidatus Zambryskibacteria bacterium RIFCSPHIGHO2_01_FULL_46_30]|uniref:Cell shape-determining protein MreB n=1 Tax=Candidatus Zambryskibacteria bacterium RIFCSPHIGHO2_01_FULL_46_30 TaxID=1802739 RepID=A0A1G2SZK9_9BACT|nr:MAG: rod shape-determining protein [Candidatus Zambryskibacteria bacterium RIFCSPHIGHO2_01_FULL_46_30]OHB05849.1 MAG: rod shape-determining protein [Candidatus Zambryskibacteria bacterium RIFCSPLOWO2_01_FULL_47_33]
MKFPGIENLRRLFSHDIGIDLGTANTLVYLRGSGIVINEPSVVAINQKTGQVVAIGTEARAMLGRTPGHILAIKPLVDGVISDFEITEEMLSYLLNRAIVGSKKVLSPRVVVGVPSGITNVEIRAVRDATANAGAGEVHIIEEPMAAAIGMRLPIREPVGNMVIDIGGGTSDIAIISLGGVVRSKNLRIAGDKFNSDIVAHVRNQFKVLLGEKTAEMIKTSIGSVLPTHAPLEMPVRGRDLVSGLPKEIILTDTDIRDALSQSIESIIEAIREVLESTPPDILSDIMNRGVYLSGGGALVKGLPELVESEINIPVHVALDPLTAVARGTGIILEDLKSFEDILIKNEGELPPKK